jgi:hypothetical protein
MYGPECAAARRARRSGGIDICKIGDKYEGPADGAQEADLTFEGVKGCVFIGTYRRLRQIFQVCLGRLVF